MQVLLGTRGGQLRELAGGGNAPIESELARRSRSPTTSNDDGRLDFVGVVDADVDPDALAWTGRQVLVNTAACLFPAGGPHQVQLPATTCRSRPTVADTERAAAATEVGRGAAWSSGRAG